MPVEAGVEERDTADDGVCATTAAAAVLRPQRRELVTERNTHRPIALVEGIGPSPTARFDVERISGCSL